MPPRTDIHSELKRILTLAWPVMLTSLNWTLLHITDVIVVGEVSTEQVAALGAGRALTFFTIVTGLAWLSGVLVFVSRADGAKRLADTGEVLRQGLILALLLGCATALLLYFGADRMLSLMGVPAEIAHDGAQVVRVMALAHPAQFLIIAASYFLEGVSRPRRVMVVNLSMLPFNALLAWAWSGGHLGLPMMGAVGAALATMCASFFGAVAMLVAVWALPRAEPRRVRDLSAAAWGRAARAMPALARFGTVPAIASALEIAGFSWLIALSTQLGEVTAHAFQILFSIHNLVFSIALGLGSAAGVRVGNAVGEERPEEVRPRAFIAAGMAAVATGCMALVIGLGATPIAQLFPAVGAVHILAAALLPLWAPFILFDGLQIVFLYVLRSLGDQVVAGVNGIVAFFCVTSGLGWTLVSAGWGAKALVYASGIGMLTAALLDGGRLLWISSRHRR